MRRLYEVFCNIRVVLLLLSPEQSWGRRFGCETGWLPALVLPRDLASSPTFCTPASRITRESCISALDTYFSDVTREAYTDYRWGNVLMVHVWRHEYTYYTGNVLVISSIALCFTDDSAGAFSWWTRVHTLNACFNPPLSAMFSPCVCLPFSCQQEGHINLL